MGESTLQYQKHEPSVFCYIIKCFDDTIYKPKLVLYTKKTDNENISKIFVDMIESDLNNIDQRFFRFPKKIKLTQSHVKDFNKATHCYVCKNELLEDKVRDHCHFTGKYKGAAHIMSVI